MLHITPVAIAVLEESTYAILGVPAMLSLDVHTDTQRSRVLIRYSYKKNARVLMCFISLL